jgi:hypothetical protein
MTANQMIATIRRFAPGVGIIMLAALPLCSHGQGTTFNTRSAFNAAISGGTTITFESLTPSNPNSLGVSPIITQGTTFSNAEARLFIASPTNSGGSILYPTPGTGKYLWNFDSGYPPGIFLPANKTAFAADFSGGLEPNPSYNATLTVNLLDGRSYNFNFSGPQNAFTFFGVAFNAPINNLVYNDGGSTHEEMLDNVTFGSTVPEPAPIALFASSLLVLGAYRRGAVSWR